MPRLPRQACPEHAKGPASNRARAYPGHTTGYYMARTLTDCQVEVKSDAPVLCFQHLVMTSFGLHRRGRRRHWITRACSVFMKIYLTASDLAHIYDVKLRDHPQLGKP